jgi:hypothetical protein
LIKNTKYHHHKEELLESIDLSIHVVGVVAVDGIRTLNIAKVEFCISSRNLPSSIAKMLFNNVDVLKMSLI